MALFTQLCPNNRLDGVTAGATKRFLNAGPAGTVTGIDTGGAGSAGGRVVSSCGFTSGRRWVRMVVTAGAETTGADNVGLSLVNNNTGPIVGTAANHLTITTNGHLRLGNVNVVTDLRPTSRGVAVGDVLELVYDVEAGLAWARVYNGASGVQGAWNANPAADPAGTGVGGVDVSALIQPTEGQAWFAQWRASAGHRCQFDWENSSGSMPAGCSLLPHVAPPIGWEFAMDAGTRFEIVSAAPLNGRRTLVLRFTVDATPAAWVGARFRTVPFAIQPGVSYAAKWFRGQRSGSTSSVSWNTSIWRYDDADKNGLLGGLDGVALTTASVPWVGPVVPASNEKPFAAFGVVVGLNANGSAGTSVTVTVQMPTFMEAASDAALSAQPWILTGASWPLTMDWRQFTDTADVQVGRGGPNDPPAGVSSLCVEAFSPSGFCGAPTADLPGGGSAGGCYYRRDAYPVSAGDVLSWTIAPKATAFNEAAPDLYVLRGSEVVLCAPAGPPGSGQAGAVGPATSVAPSFPLTTDTLIGTWAFGGSAGGTPSGAVGGGGGGSGGRYGSATGGSATGPAGTSYTGGVNGTAGRGAGLSPTSPNVPGGGMGGAGAGATEGGAIASRGEVWVGWVPPPTGGNLDLAGNAGAFSSSVATFAALLSKGGNASGSSSASATLGGALQLTGSASGIATATALAVFAFRGPVNLAGVSSGRASAVASAAFTGGNPWKPGQPIAAAWSPPAAAPAAWTPLTPVPGGWS